MVDIYTCKANFFKAKRLLILIGTRLDSIAVLLNIVIVILAIWMAKLGVDVGNKTGNLLWWRVFTFGWVLIGIARTLTAFTYSDFLSEPFYRNISSFMVVFAICLMLYGMYNFARVVVSRGGS